MRLEIPSTHVSASKGGGEGRPEHHLNDGVGMGRSRSLQLDWHDVTGLNCRKTTGVYVKVLLPDRFNVRGIAVVERANRVSGLPNDALQSARRRLACRT